MNQWDLQGLHPFRPLIHRVLIRALQNNPLASTDIVVTL